MNGREQQGRSMVEMIGVLAIVGILGITGIVGYTIAMKRYQANQILDTANKYAALVYIGKKNQAALDKTSDEKVIYNVPSTKQIGFNIIGATIDTPNSKNISSHAVLLTINFEDIFVCRMAASTLGLNCMETTNLTNEEKSNNQITYAFPQS